MSKNIVIMGKTYNDAPSVRIKKAEGGFAEFVDSNIHYGEFTPTANTGTVTIDVGFTGCTKLAIFSNTTPGTNTQDLMAWNGTTDMTIWSRYRGSYNTAYGKDSGSVVVNGQNITISTTQTNCYFNKNKTYTWIAM